MNDINKFYKITIQDKELNCYNMKPFNFAELNDATTLSDGSTITTTMKNRAFNMFRNLSMNSNTENKCCDPNDILSNPGSYSIYNDFINQYPKYRNIIENGKLSEIELTTDAEKPSSENWKEMDAMTYCRINKALSNSSLIKETEDPKVFNVKELLNDCPVESCMPDKYYTVEDLFTGSITASTTSTRIQDKEIYFGIKNGSIASLVKYINEFNDVNRLIIYQGNKYRLLHLVSEFYKEELMDAVLAMKPHLDLKDGFGNTALHVAVSSNNYYAVEKLLDAGATKDLKDSSGMTPIMKALLVKSDDNIFNNYTYLTLLHNAGASIYSLDNDGNNLLHIAVLNEVDNMINIVNYLIDNGVETNVKNKFNKTALQILNEKTAYLNKIPTNLKTSQEVLGKKEIGLLTAQTLIFNTIIKTNPDIYDKYINLNDLDPNIPLIHIINYRCIGENVSGRENKNECLLKGGEYKMLNNDNNLRVKFDLSPVNNDNMLYMPKVASNTPLDVHPLIQEIQANAKTQMLSTSTEEQYPGEYIIRDVISASGKSNDTFKNSAIEKFNTEKINEKNILEGFNNSTHYLTKQRHKDIFILILAVILVFAFILILYKLTVY
jgi:ankyrin repeat protein